MASLQLSPGPARRAVLSRRIRLFAAATISYNLIEAVVALWAGGTADSSALLGFGLGHDEVCMGLVGLQLGTDVVADVDVGDVDREDLERRAGVEAVFHQGP